MAFGTFELFGKQSGLTGIPGVTDLGFIHFGSKASYYYLILAFALIGMIIMLAFTKAWTGRSWLGLGSSQKLAESVGIDPFGYRIINFAIMSVIPALLGTAYACYLGAIQPVTFGPFIGINFQIVAFVGGLGYLVAGPIVGALFMTLLPELLRVAGSYEPIITAVIIILVIMFLPERHHRVAGQAACWPCSAGSRGARCAGLWRRSGRRLAAGPRCRRRGGGGMSAILETKGLTKRFGGLVAVNDLDLQVEEGEILGLIGPNGAGKSTVFGLVSGFLPVTSGQVIFDGKDITNHAPYRIARAGIARAFQQSLTFKGMTVLDNVLVGFHKIHQASLASSVVRSERARAEERELEEKAMETPRVPGDRRAAGREAGKPAPRASEGAGRRDRPGVGAASSCCWTSRRPG